MIKWSSKHIVFLAAFFFTAFVGVFTTNVLCDLEIIEYAPNLAHHNKGDNENSKTKHQDGHEHGHGQDRASHHQDDSNSEDPCCDDVTSQLEASLYSKIVKDQVFDAKYFLIGSISLSNKIFTHYQSNSIIYHEYDDPPPLGGFSIRVLIQSFLS